MNRACAKPLALWQQMECMKYHPGSGGMETTCRGGTSLLLDVRFYLENAVVPAEFTVVNEDIQPMAVAAISV
jgi:hypothetical protein